MRQWALLGVLAVLVALAVYMLVVDIWFLRF